MLSALEYAGYDVHHEWGDGEHNSRHATAIFPRRSYAGCGATSRRRSGEPGGEVAPGRLPGRSCPATSWTARRRGLRLHRGPGRQREGRGVLRRPAEQPHPQGRTRRQGQRLRREHQRRERPRVRPRRPALRRRRRARGRSSPTTWGRRNGRGHRREDAVNDLTVSNARATSTSPTIANQKVWLLAEGRHAARRRRRHRVARTASSSRPTRRLLYVAGLQSASSSWAFQVQADGSLTHKQPYIYVHVPDGRDAQLGATASRWTPTAASISRPRSACRCSIRSASATPSCRRRSAWRSSNVDVRRAELRRALPDQRRQGLQAQDEGEGRPVVARRDQAAAAAVVDRPGHSDRFSRDGRLAARGGAQASSRQEVGTARALGVRAVFVFC